MGDAGKLKLRPLSPCHLLRQDYLRSDSSSSLSGNSPERFSDSFRVTQLIIGRHGGEGSGSGFLCPRPVFLGFWLGFGSGPPQSPRAASSADPVPSQVLPTATASGWWSHCSLVLPTCIRCDTESRTALPFDFSDCSTVGEIGLK